MNTERFTVTEEHLTLLRRAYVGWDACAFGAPAIDCKRPYGNSDVFGDLAEILGIKPSEDEYEPFTSAEVDRMRRLHIETATALQIALRTGEFKAGTYEREAIFGEWTRVEEPS